MHKPELYLEFDSDPFVLANMRQRVRKFAEALPALTFQVNELELAVDEAVTNVIVHAYPGAGKGLIQVRVWKEGENIIVAVRDFGKSYRPKPVNEELVRQSLRNLSKKGLGRYIMLKCMDSVKYISLARKYNETTMVKKITKPGR